MRFQTDRSVVVAVGVTLVIATFGLWLRAVAGSENRMRTASHPATQPDGAIAASWIKPGVELRRVSQTGFVDAQAWNWLQEECVFPLSASGHPREAFERLALVHKGEYLPVNWPPELRGSVHIRSRDDALAFVRLFSSPKTWYLFPEFGYLELSVGKSRPLVAGGIDEATFKSLGLSQLEIVACKDGYRIRRPVVKVFRFGAMAAATIDETVLEDGTYYLRVLCRKGLPDGDDRVFIPRPL